MKRIILSLLAFAALAGCSENERENAPFGDEVPITLRAGLPAAAIASDSRAVVETGTAFTAGVAGWGDERCSGIRPCRGVVHDGRHHRLDDRTTGLAGRVAGL